MNCIVAVDSNWGIGKGGTMPWSIPADMRFFRDTTMNKVVVMGRKTLESFPNGLVLPKRTNIVLTKNQGFKAKGATVLHSEEELLEALKEYPTEDVFVIGGAAIYRQLLPLCDTAYVTHIHHSYDVDTYFPKLDEMKEWEQVYVGDEQTCFDIEFEFTTYKKREL